WLEKIVNICEHSDFVIFEKLNRLPKNHSERFRILREYFPVIYVIIDDIFDKYTDSYSKPVLKETCEMMKVGIKKFSETSDLPEEIVGIIEKT
ncbi:MAG: hypothetical protein ACE5DM_02590, partial [Candidatus Nanoarchaeia archaeon]